MNKLKIAVTGAAGQLGYALLFRLVRGEVFGEETEIELQLLELEQAMPALRGVGMELEDCAFPLLKKIILTSDPEEAFNDIDWALLIGSVPRKAGMERGDLLKINAKVFVGQGRALNMAAKRSCRVLVVGNPCNTNAFIAQRMAPNISPENFFAMTMLDEKRAVAQAARKAQTSVAEIKNLVVWGNHSSTQFPDIYHALIKGKPATEVIREEEWIRTTFLKTVQERGAEILKARGLSSAASAANAVIETVKALNHPTPEGEAFSLAVVSDGSYGIEQGTVFSFPVVSDGKHWRIVQGVRHNAFAEEKIRLTQQELLQEKRVVEKFLE